MVHQMSGRVIPPNEETPFLSLLRLHAWSLLLLILSPSRSSLSSFLDRLSFFFLNLIKIEDPIGLCCTYHDPVNPQENLRDFVMSLRVIIFLFTLLCRRAQSWKSPSYYYDQCAPSLCGDSVVQFPLGLNPLCRIAFLSSSCENGSVYVHREKGDPTKYRILDTLTSSVYDRGIFTLVDSSLLGCGPIPNSDASIEGFMLFIAKSFALSSDYKTGTFYNCTRPPESDVLARLTPAPCLDCPTAGAESSKFLCYYYDGYMDDQVSDHCSSISLVFEKDLQMNNFTGGGKNLRRKLQEGFQLQWKGSTCGAACMSSTNNKTTTTTTAGNISGSGRCGFADEERREVGSEMCFCASSVHKTSCSDGTYVSN